MSEGDKKKISKVLTIKQYQSKTIEQEQDIAAVEKEMKEISEIDSEKANN